MSGAKQKVFFYTLFRNVPYTDEEWEREHNRRLEIARNKECSPEYRAKYSPHKTRPVHRWQYGPTCTTHEEAKKACERALDRGAQLVEYTVVDEKWLCGTDLVWKQFIRNGYGTRYRRA